MRCTLEGDADRLVTEGPVTKNVCTVSNSGVFRSYEEEV